MYKIKTRGSSMISRRNVILEGTRRATPLEEEQALAYSLLIGLQELDFGYTHHIVFLRKSFRISQFMHNSSVPDIPYSLNKMYQKIIFTSKKLGVFLATAENPEEAIVDELVFVIQSPDVPSYLHNILFQNLVVEITKREANRRF